MSSEKTQTGTGSISAEAPDEGMIVKNDLSLADQRSSVEVQLFSPGSNAVEVKPVQADSASESQKQGQQHPVEIQILLSILKENHELSVFQYDHLIKYLNEQCEDQKKADAEKALNEELGAGSSNIPAADQEKKPPMTAEEMHASMEKVHQDPRIKKFKETFQGEEENEK